MKVDSRFHCFGCGADGDVIDFTAKLFQLSLLQAAEKLAADFGLSATDTFNHFPASRWKKPLSPKEQFYKIPVWLSFSASKLAQWPYAPKKVQKHPCILVL